MCLSARNVRDGPHGANTERPEYRRRCATPRQHRLHREEQLRRDRQPAMLVRYSTLTLFFLRRILLAFYCQAGPMCLGQ